MVNSWIDAVVSCPSSQGNASTAESNSSFGTQQASF